MVAVTTRMRRRFRVPYSDIVQWLCIGGGSRAVGRGRCRESVEVEDAKCLVFLKGPALNLCGQKKGKGKERKQGKGEIAFVPHHK